MKRTMVMVLGLALSGSAAFADQWVNGYVRSDGTYVEGYMRSSPNGYSFDNYSTKGNVNPYTGEKGTKRDDYSYPSSKSLGYGGRSSRGSGLYSPGW